MAEKVMPDISPNSFKSKQEKAAKERLKPVVGKDQVVRSKKSLGRKFAETFLESDIKDVKSYLIKDVLIPGAKNLVLDGLQMAFFHEVRRGRSSNGYIYGGSGYDYSRQYRSSSNRNKSRDRDNRYDTGGKVDYRNIVLRERVAAEDVVEELHKRIRTQGSASVADLLDLIELTGDYVDNNWGWTDERDIGIRRVSSGFLIDVAEAQYLN